jgi:hypothetical protein
MLIAGDIGGTKTDLAIYSSESASNGSIAIIAPGTGLGESFLTSDGSWYQAHVLLDLNREIGGPSRSRRRPKLAKSKWASTPREQRETLLTIVEAHDR